MYLLREGSHNSNEPYMVTIPQPETNYLEKQTLFFPEIGVAKWFFESGIAERGLINWIMENFIKEDTIMIDIGAHVGTYSWIPAKVAKHVYSFECNPKIFCYLAANIALHRLEDKITPYQFALGNKEGTIDYLLRSEDGGGNGVKVLSDNDNNVKKIKIQMKTLDSFELNNIGFIKMDVEGFEKEVLMGALETLKRSNYPNILFECWGEWKEREGVPAIKIKKELFEYLESLGYKIIQVGGAQDMFLAEHKK